MHVLRSPILNLRKWEKSSASWEPIFGVSIRSYTNHLAVTEATWIKSLSSQKPKMQPAWLHGWSVYFWCIKKKCFSHDMIQLFHNTFLSYLRIKHHIHNWTDKNCLKHMSLSGVGISSILVVCDFLLLLLVQDVETIHDQYC